MPLARDERLSMCTKCLALAHVWGTPRTEDIELAGERFGIYSYRCACQCGCPALLTHPGPPMGPSVPSWFD